MRHEQKENSGVSALVVFCETCGTDGHTAGRHLALIHNGYGENAEDITQTDVQAANMLATTHENQTGHEVVIYHYVP